MAAKMHSTTLEPCWFQVVKTLKTQFQVFKKFLSGDRLRLYHFKLGFFKFSFNLRSLLGYKDKT